MKYEKPVAEVIYFTNRDVITTSGGESGSCRVPGHDRGNNCPSDVSGACPGQAWKP